MILNENFDFDESYLRIMDEVIKNELSKDVNVGLIVVDKDEMAKLNYEYRKMKGPTDVLTFVYGDEDLYAEVFICEDVIRDNAIKYSNTFEKELLTVLIHAALHVSGYDHEYDTTKAEEMFKKQDEYLKKYLG
ncbi:MAG: rRNA maturation RNase YbeY [Thermosipho sp. (in: Bacteria)]|nr:rRNA maturation RNase YbeY [Thermosipho sp. (in: thermotogales)]